MKNNISVEFTKKVAMLRIARLVNALSFCELVRTAPQPYANRDHARLQKIFVQWLMGGYLYEAVHLIDDLAENFGTSYPFRELMRFAATMRPYRELFAEMNCSPAFTMDWGGATSERICETLHFETKQLAEWMVGGNPRIPVYAEAANLDAKWVYELVKQFMDPVTINETIPDGLDLFSKMFRLAAVTFIEGQALGRAPEEEQTVGA